MAFPSFISDLVQTWIRKILSLQTHIRHPDETVPQSMIPSPLETEISGRSDSDFSAESLIGGDVIMIITHTESRIPGQSGHTLNPSHLPQNPSRREIDMKHQKLFDLLTDDI